MFPPLAFIPVHLEFVVCELVFSFKDKLRSGMQCPLFKQPLKKKSQPQKLYLHTSLAKNIFCKSLSVAMENICLQDTKSNRKVAHITCREICSDKNLSDQTKIKLNMRFCVCVSVSGWGCV